MTNVRHPKRRNGMLTRRTVLKTAGAATIAAGGSLGFPAVLRYALGETPIKVGSTLSLTGNTAIAGEEMANCSRLAVEHINQKGGVLGRKVEIIIRDDAGNAALTATRAKELIENEKVDLMAGGNLGHTTHALHQQTVPKKMLLMANAMSNEITSVPMFSKYTFHPDITMHMAGSVVGKFAAEKLGRRWYFLVADYAFGWACYNAFSRVNKEYKGENLGISAHPIGTADFSTYVGKIMAAQPEVLVVANAGRDQINAWKQLREFGAVEKMKVVAPLFQPSSIWAVGVESVWGGYGGATFYWEAPETQWFTDVYWKAFGKPSGDDGISQYEAVMELLSAVNRAKSLNPDRVVKALEGHRFKWCKDEEWWRPCDHQAIQDIYVLGTKRPQKTYDTFEIVAKIGGEELEMTCEERNHKKDAKGEWIRYQ
jgi:branched-chain amino acid transport system substrate-binding protein